MSENTVTPIVEAATSPQSAPSPSQASSTDSPNPWMAKWREISHSILKKSLPLNPLTTQPDEFSEVGSHCFMTLSPLSANEQQPEDFFEKIFTPHASPKSPYRVAIIGESGTGKTLILQRLASWLWSNSEAIPIFLSPTELQDLSLEQYIYHKWLRQAATLNQDKPENLENDLQKLIKSGKLWLLLDGIDFIKAKEIIAPISPLGRIASELESWGKTVQVVLNCRHNSWQEALSQETYLSHQFDCYYTKKLNYPTNVNQFIEEWFLSGNGQAAQEMIEALTQVSCLAYQKAIANPLRLALLCRWWQQHPQTLPQTLTQLYDVLVQEYYEWKAETTDLPRQKQETLKQWLGKWACDALETSTLPQRWAFKVEEDPEAQTWLRWGLQMAWLTPLSSLPAYEFSDRTFAAYFAGMSVTDVSYFLKDLEIDRQNGGSNTDLPAYPRFFNPQWQQVLFFWLGRSDVEQSQKETLIERLITFNDECGTFNFFGKIAYLLAGESLAHFPQSISAQKIIDQIILWAFPKSDNSTPFSEQAKDTLSATDMGLAIEGLIQGFLVSEDSLIGESVWKWLEKQTVLPEVGITALTRQLETTNVPRLRWKTAECLGKIVPGHPLALSVFTDLLTLESEQGDEFKEIGLKGLGKIGKNQPSAINALLNLLRSSQGSSLQRRVFQCLEMIGLGSSLAIASLTQWIRCSQDANFRRMAAECLEKIDPSNPTAISVLVGLLQEGNSEEIRRMAIYSIGEVEPGNRVAINGLVTLLNQTDDILTQWVAISSLGKIGRDDPQATNTLVKLIESSEGLLVRKEAIESLGKLDATHPSVISALVGWVQVGNEESLRREAAESLGKLDPGNPEAIAGLGHLLQTADDPFTRRQAAASLGRIDSGNLEALNTLVQLIKTSPDTDIQSLAADSLGELGANNPAVIATLIRLLKSTLDKDTFRRTARSLGKIGKGNREVIGTMMDLLCQHPFSMHLGVKEAKPYQDEGNRIELAQSLSQILLTSQIPQIVTLLQEFFDKHPNLTQGSEPCGRLLWHCATQLSYREFYQAWHQRIGTKSKKSVVKANLVNSSNVSVQVSDDHESDSDNWLVELNKKLNNESKNPEIKLVSFDTGEFLDLENPAIDIYDQMLAQGCPEFSHGLPETLSKLRLHWQLLERNYPNQQFIFIFYGKLINEPTLQSFWQLLNKFHAKVAVVGQDSTKDFEKINTKSLSYFVADHPQLVENLLEWIR